MVGYMRRNFLVPVPSFESFEALNAHLERRCLARMDARLRGHSESIGQRMERDLEALLPLPAVAYDACEKQAGRVSSLSLVRYRTNEADLLKDVVFGVLRSLLSWAVWALLAWFVGSKILGTRDIQADWGQLARGTGFAQTPGILKVFIFIPILGLIIELGAALWQFAAMVIAVRQSLDYTSTLRAFAVVIISFVPVAIINGIVIWALRIGGTPVPPA